MFSSSRHESAFSFADLLEVILLAGCFTTITFVTNAGCSRSRLPSEQRWERIEKKCGPKPQPAVNLEQYELHLKIEEADLSFPYQTQFRQFDPDEREFPEFAYKIRLLEADPATPAYYSLKRPQQARDGMYEFDDIRLGQRLIIKPNLEISLVRVTAECPDEESQKRRKAMQDYVSEVRAWEECCQQVGGP